MKQRKKISLFGSLLLFALVLTLTSCGDQKKDETPKPDVDPPEQLIGLDQAQAMYKNYSERRAPLIQHYEDSIDGRGANDKVQQKVMEEAKKEKDSFDVARYIHWDYQTIKQYMDYLDQETKKAGIEVTSIRFYLTNYPDEKTFPDGRAIKHPRQNSLVVVPTLTKDGQEYGFFAEHIGTPEQKITLLNGRLQFAEVGLGANSSGASFKTQRQPKNAAAASLAPFMLYGNGNCCLLNEGNSAPPPHK